MSVRAAHVRNHAGLIKPQHCHQVEPVIENVISPDSCKCDTHPVGLSGSWPSALLNVTLRAAGAGVTGATGLLCDPVCAAPMRRFSSSSSSARNECEEGGDCTAVALQT